MRREPPVRLRTLVAIAVLAVIVTVIGIHAFMGEDGGIIISGCGMLPWKGRNENLLQRI